MCAQIVINPETQISKGFGFVKFEDPRDGEDAIREADGKVGFAYCGAGSALLARLQSCMLACMQCRLL